MKRKCTDCEKTFKDNPRRCSGCGNTILKPVTEPEKNLDSVIKGENVKQEGSFLDKLRFWK